MPPEVGTRRLLEGSERGLSRGYGFRLVAESRRRPGMEGGGGIPAAQRWKSCTAGSPPRLEQRPGHPGWPVARGDRQGQGGERRGRGRSAEEGRGGEG